MKIIWISANKFGYELLKEALKIRQFNVDAIITLNSEAKTVMYDDVGSSKWYKFGVPVIEVKQLNSEIDQIRKLSPDLIIVCGWRQIIAKNILEIPKYGVIGFHPTLLPFGRGAAPIINTILKGIQHSGLSMFYLSEGLDDGDIIAQQQYIISDSDHAGDVYKKLIKAGKCIVKKHFPLVLKNEASRKPQNGINAVVFEKPLLTDNKIDFESESLDEIFSKIKALSYPYQGAYIEKDGKRLRIWRAELESI